MMHHSLLAAAAVAAAAAGTLPYGSWQQASDGTELVLVSKVKLTPSGGGYWGGTSLGGSAGMGSATTTRIVTEATPLKVSRRMSLAISGDGTFKWHVTKSYFGEKGCRKTIEQEKVGKASVEATELVLRITGGSETSSGCGAPASGRVAQAVERYSAAARGNVLVLTGPGGVRWNFNR